MISLPPGLVWLMGGVVLMGLEALMPGAFMVWIGLAAVGTGLVTGTMSLDFPGEVVVFAVLALAAVGAGLLLRRARRPSGLNTPGSGLVGRTAHALSIEGREGRVRIGDSDWSARLAAGAAWPERPTPLEVVGVDGCVVLVRPQGP
jgi:membrane protein implicated in regulation of membrane protease activity